MVDSKDPIRRVYLATQVPKDILAAARRLSPDVYCVSHSSIFPDNVDQMMDDVMSHAWKMLQYFDFKRDVLGLVGDPFVIAVCMHVLSCRMIWQMNRMSNRGDDPATLRYRIAKYDNKFGEFLVHPFPQVVGDDHGKGSNQEETGAPSAQPVGATADDRQDAPKDWGETRRGRFSSND